MRAVTRTAFAVFSLPGVRSFGGEMQARLKFANDGKRERAEAMVGGDLDRVFETDDLTSGGVVFVATGVTSGDLLKGVRYSRGFARTETIVMDASMGTIRRIETIHRHERRP
ncbi:MAG: fructose-bisphosphatase class II [Fimbriimonadaceae bacterium]